ncbi:MAG: type IV pili methyl-accepting chemotaxis transducer N-terminal domain-containing protein [Litoreibacter sp.]|nr:type IV pili methyl-accepting chemotaxis transducer N-terminal domain-containing protein [Litoreibacter sp.]
MLSTIKYTALAVSCAVAMQSGIAVADESKLVRVALAPQDNAEQRINLSGKLRMLSQRIPSVACQISRGVDVEGAGKLLTAAQTEFDKILNALEHGDEDLNIINPETRKKTLIRIHELRAQWEPLRIAAQAIANGTGSDEDVGVVLSQNAEVLEAAVRLVPELVK